MGEGVVELVVELAAYVEDRDLEDEWDSSTTRELRGK